MTDLEQMLFRDWSAIVLSQMLLREVTLLPACTLKQVENALDKCALAVQVRAEADGLDLDRFTAKWETGSLWDAEIVRWLTEILHKLQKGSE